MIYIPNYDIENALSLLKYNQFNANFLILCTCLRYTISKCAWETKWKSQQKKKLFSSFFFVCHSLPLVPYIHTCWCCTKLIFVLLFIEAFALLRHKESIRIMLVMIMIMMMMWIENEIQFKDFFFNFARFYWMFIILSCLLGNYNFISFSTSAWMWRKEGKR